MLSAHAPPTPDEVAALSAEFALACDPAGTVVWADERATRVVPSPVGRPLAGLVVPGDEEKARNFLRAARAAEATRGSEPWELGLVGRTGPETVRLRGAPRGDGVLVVGAVLPGGYGVLLADAGELTHELLVLQRESERQRRELQGLASRQAAILEQMPSGVVVVDAAGRTVVRNDTARRLTPWATDRSAADAAAAAAADGPPRDARSGRPLRAEEWPLARALAGERVARFDYRWARADGTPDVWVRASAVPLRGPRHTITGAVGVFTDVTADHRAERARNVSLASAAHEFRSPLTSMVGFTDLLLEGELGPLAEDQVDALRRISANAKQLGVLIEDLLAITTIESGHVDSRPASVDVGAVLAAVVGSFAPQARAKHQHVRLEVPAAPLLAWADDRRLAQIVGNLVSNAHKYTPDGGRIVVAAAAEPDGARVTVRDTGVGLTAEELGRVGTKFYRAHNKAAGDVPGTGLGLAIVRALIETQGGSMTIESTPGVGSVFGFRLPPDRAPRAAPRDGPALPKRPPPAT